MPKIDNEQARYRQMMLERAARRFSRRVERKRRRFLQNRDSKRRHGIHTSAIIEMLASKATHALPSSNGEIRVRVPSRYSIIENPEVVLDLLTSFAKGVYSNSIQRVVFDHRDLEDVDLAANSLLDIVATERNAEFIWRRSRRKLRIAGAYPRAPALKRLIKATGIIKHMEIAHEALSHDENQTVRVFEARNRSYSNPGDGSRADFKDKQQANFVNHFQDCLRDVGWELSELGIQKLGTYLGEILANAEDHPDYLDWTVQGYLDKSLAVPMCEIAVFNFGRSIAEAMLSVEKNGYTWNQVLPYLEMHTKRKFFGDSWREEDLLTVIALQGNVSSLNTSVKTTRGQGTVEFIEFFQRINDLCSGSSMGARMAIVSGGTYILFDGTYRMTSPAEDKGGIIAFNATNDLNEKPDSRYVRGLGSFRFPGTVISIKFPLSLADSTLVEEITSDSKHDD